MIALRPSGSAIWTRCPAAPLFQEHAPKLPESDASREGTCAAWVAETTLNGSLVASTSVMIGERHANGWEVTPDMAYHVQGYVNLVRSRGGEISAERFVRLNEFIAGTLDSSVDSTVRDGLLIVDDLKFGMKTVEVFENTQVIIYAEARTLELEAMGQRVDNVQLGIYQPRAYHPNGPYRPWTITRAELRTWAEWIVQRGWLCQSPNPVAEPGEHCLHCEASSVCAAAALTLQKGFEIVRDSRYRHLSDEEVAAELDFLDLLKSILDSRLTTMRADGETRLRKGKHIRGWYLKSRKGNRVWKASPLVVQALTGIDPRAEATVTPAELERRGANVEVVKALTHSPDIPPQLAKLSDKAIRKAFER